MNRKFFLFFCVVSLSSSAQNPEKYPVFRNSLAIELASVPFFVNDLIHSDASPIYLWPPLMSFSFEGRVKKKFYWEGGAILGSDDEEFVFAFFTGAVFKFKISRNFFFTPSIDLYIQPINSGYVVGYIGVGPTIGFEYFLSPKISLNSDWVNLNLGGEISPVELSSPGGARYTETESFSTYKFFSLGIHYNYDWKKKSIITMIGRKRK
ncbi:MAG TPA: hypothetical protein VE978_16195 [Chitinophagales bacterium]|nr:hypothetical protein [Chitinophagales bacterium]